MRLRNTFSFYFKDKYYYEKFKKVLIEKWNLKYVNDIKAFQKDYEKIYNELNKNIENKADKKSLYVLNVKTDNNINNIFFMLMLLAFIANKHNIKEFKLEINFYDKALKEALQKLFQIIFYYKNKEIDENAKNANINNNKDLIFLQIKIKQKDEEIKKILKKFNINFNEIKIKKNGYIKLFYKKLNEYLKAEKQELQDFDEVTKG